MWYHLLKGSGGRKSVVQRMIWCESAIVALMDAYLQENGYVNDMNDERFHHDIYMSDTRKGAPEKWKTVIRHPIRKAVE